MRQNSVAVFSPDPRANEDNLIFPTSNDLLLRRPWRMYDLIDPPPRLYRPGPSLTELRQRLVPDRDTQIEEREGRDQAVEAPAIAPAGGVIGIEEYDLRTMCSQILDNTRANKLAAVNPDHITP